MISGNWENNHNLINLMMQTGGTLPKMNILKISEIFRLKLHLSLFHRP